MADEEEEEEVKEEADVEAAKSGIRFTRCGLELAESRLPCFIDCCHFRDLTQNANDESSCACELWKLHVLRLQIAHSRALCKLLGVVTVCHVVTCR